MISVDEARAVVLASVNTLPTETVQLAAAFSRVLRSPVVSDRDSPPFNRAAMDGYAVRSADTSAPDTRLQVTGEVRAGVWPDKTVRGGEAFRIMTGAPVPEGADAVVQVERTRRLSSEQSLAEGSDSQDVLIETAVTCNHCGYCQSHGH